MRQRKVHKNYNRKWGGGRKYNRLHLTGDTVVDKNSREISGRMHMIYECMLYILAAVFSVLMLRGIMQSYCAVWEVEYRQDWNRTFIWISLLAVMITWIGRWKKWSIWLAVFVLLAGGFWRAGSLIEGAKELANPVLQSWYDYYGVDFGCYKLNTISELEMTMVYIALYLALGFVWAMVHSGKRLPIALPGCAIIILILLVGKNPDLEATVYLISGMLPALAYTGENLTGKRSIRRKSGDKKQVLPNPARYRAGIAGCICMAGIWILGVIGFHTAGNDRISPYVLGKHKELLTFQKKLEADIESFAASIPGGIAIFGGANIQSGKITNKSPYFVGKDIFTVTVDKKPETKFYFRGFVGYEYVNGQWIPMEHSEFQKKVSGWGVIDENAGRRILNKSYVQGFDLAGRDVKSNGISMGIRYMDEAEGYAYIPYYTNLFRKETEILTVDADAMLYKPKDVRDIFIYSLEMFPDSIFNDWIGSWWDAELWTLETEYMEDARKTYTQLPKGKLSDIKELAAIWREQGYGVVEMDPNYAIPIQKVTKELAARTEYTRKPGYLPDGEDVVEYFLFENKKGFCIHYASAGTLLLRGLGVPARYVSGYAIDPSDFVENEDGTYTAVVEDNKGHAWAEVYLSGTGWIPIELTEGVSSMNYGMDENSLKLAEEAREWMRKEGLLEEPAQTKKPEQNPDKPEQSKPKPQTNVPVKEDTDRNIPVSEILEYVLVVILVFAVAGVGIYLNRVRISRQRRLYSRDRKVAVEEIAYRITKLLYRRGILEEKNLTDEDYIRLASGKMKELGETEFQTFMCVVQKSTFSEYVPTAEEVKLGRRIYHSLKSDSGVSKSHQRS